MYKRLTRSRVHVELACPENLGLGIIYIIIVPCIYVCRAPEYMWNSYPTPSWVRNYLNYYFTMYICLRRSRVHVEHASPAYLGLGII